VPAVSAVVLQKVFAGNIDVVALRKNKLAPLSAPGDTKIERCMKFSTVFGYVPMEGILQTISDVTSVMLL
jgi:hypothetical protein